MDAKSIRDISYGLDKKTELIKIIHKYFPNIDESNINTIDDIIKLFHPELVNENHKSIFRCIACKSNNTIYRNIQLRSADEGANTIITCNDCNVSFSI
jgi:DNA-directed RNA polymerase subunit M/transcription elongation factor TFIIS